MPSQIDQSTALRIIQALRQGNERLEYARLFSVGRTALFRAAAEQLHELEISESAVVRWLKGRYGNGKTHVLARLAEIAHERNWITSYVQISGRGEGTELHRFEEIYAAIVGNCISVIPDSQHRGERDIQGLEPILDAWFLKLRALAGAHGSEDLPFLRFRDVLGQALIAFQRNWGVHGAFVSALRQYALTRADGSAEQTQFILDWFRAHNLHAQPSVRVWLRNVGLRESISRRNAKEMLRALSVFLRYRGFGGILILLDEVENVLHQPPVARRMGYTILRELIDNVDDRHGMTRAAFYISGTPDVFEGEKGITENEALATRVLLGGGNGTNPFAPLIDLSHFPLCQKDLLEIAVRIATIYSVASNSTVPPSYLSSIQGMLEHNLSRNPDLSPRTWVKTVVDTLDRTNRQSTA
jgi:adenosylhomocysteinase